MYGGGVGVWADAGAHHQPQEHVQGYYGQQHQRGQYGQFQGQGHAALVGTDGAGSAAGRGGDYATHAGEQFQAHPSAAAGAFSNPFDGSAYGASQPLPQAQNAGWGSNLNYGGYGAVSPPPASAPKTGFGDNVGSSMWLPGSPSEDLHAQPPTGQWLQDVRGPAEQTASYGGHSASFAQPEQSQAGKAGAGNSFYESSLFFKDMVTAMQDPSVVGGKGAAASVPQQQPGGSLSGSPQSISPQSIFHFDTLQGKSPFLANGSQAPVGGVPADPSTLTAAELVLKDAVSQRKAERPRLNLLPRTKPLPKAAQGAQAAPAQAVQQPPTGASPPDARRPFKVRLDAVKKSLGSDKSKSTSSIFGNAKPREEVLRQRGERVEDVESWQQVNCGKRSKAKAIQQSKAKALAEPKEEPDPISTMGNSFDILGGPQ